MKINYHPSWWFMIVEACVSIAILVVGAVTLSTQPCGTSQISFNLNVWLLVAGCIGLFYSLVVFIFMFLFTACICLVCCTIPLLIIVLTAKILFYVAWAIVGILFLSFNSSLVSSCPVAFGFAIGAIVCLLIDTIPTYKYTTIEE